MPAKRLPWYKVWVGTSRHAKVVGLSDRSFRIWHELLDAASEQKIRGRFDSLETAARVVRRKVAEIQPLTRAGLLDQADDGVWLHDWKDWQRWRPEDAVNDDGLPPDHPPNGTSSTHDQHANDNGTTHEELRNDSGSTHEDRLINTRSTHDDPSRGAERAKTETETETENKTSPVPSGQPPRLRVVGEPSLKPTPKATPVGMLLDKIRALDPELEIYGDHGFTGSKLKANPETNLDLVAEAYVSFRHGQWPGSKMLRETGALAWAIGDVGGYVNFRNGRSGSSRRGEYTREQAEAEFGWMKDANA